MVAHSVFTFDDYDPAPRAAALAAEFLAAELAAR